MMNLLLTVLAPSQMLATLAAFGEFLTGVFAARLVADKHGDDRHHRPSDALPFLR
jgi:hypothetical protein